MGMIMPMPRARCGMPCNTIAPGAGIAGAALPAPVLAEKPGYRDREYY